MKVLKVDWKQANGNIVKSALIIPKALNFSREDIEVIVPLDGETSKADWVSRSSWNCIFEVYPDEYSFTKRVYPLFIFNINLHSPVKEALENSISYSIDSFLRSILEDKHKDIIPDQDFSRGEIIEIDLPSFTNEA